MASSVAAPTGVVSRRETSKYTGVVALGLALMGAAVVLVVSAGLIAGQSLGEDTVLFAVAVVAAAVGSVAVVRFGTVGKVVGLVATLVVLSQVFWIVFSLFVPASFADFSAGTMFAVGTVYALGWGVAGLVRRNRPHDAATPGETRMVWIAVALVALAMVVSGVLQLTSRTTVDAAAATGAVPVGIADFTFAPSTVEVTAGTPAKLLVHNSDAFGHDFQIEALDVNAGMITPGSEKLVEVTAPAGEYQILCTIHPDMEGTLLAQ